MFRAEPERQRGEHTQEQGCSVHVSRELMAEEVPRVAGALLAPPGPLAKSWENLTLPSCHPREDVITDVIIIANER